MTLRCRKAEREGLCVAGRLDCGDMARSGGWGWLPVAGSDEAGGRGAGQNAVLDAESRRAAELVKQSWPDQSYESMVVAVLHRPGGLTDADRDYGARLSARFAAEGHPKEVVRVLGPTSPPEIARRLVSSDGTISLVAVSLSTAFVAPVTEEAVIWLEHQAGPGGSGRPRGPRGALDGRRRDRPRLHGQCSNLA